MITKINIDNFKSIKKVNIDLKKINILIGENGAGKTNFISFFKLLNNIIRANLQNYIAENDGADNLLYYGNKESKSITAEIRWQGDSKENVYTFTLVPTEADRMYFAQETVIIYEVSSGGYILKETSTGNNETALLEKHILMVNYFRERQNEFKIYHFHDTSSTARVKKSCNIDDNEVLKEDAENLAAFLYKLQQKDSKALQKIEKTVSMIAPYFEKFILKPNTLNEESIKLNWKEKNSDKVFHAGQLSDGTLRMICLITLFLQPDLPKVIILDEPELGLHPYAIHILAELIQSSAEKGTQVIVSSQSIALIDKFEMEDIIIAGRKDKESTFERLEREKFKDWLEDYTVGELWEKNLLGGRP